MTEDDLETAARILPTLQRHMWVVAIGAATVGEPDKVMATHWAWGVEPPDNVLNPSARWRRPTMEDLLHRMAHFEDGIPSSAIRKPQGTNSWSRDGKWYRWRDRDRSQTGPYRRHVEFGT